MGLVHVVGTSAILEQKLNNVTVRSQIKWCVFLFVLHVGVAVSVDEQVFNNMPVVVLTGRREAT